jgi:hypothetical protein
MNPAPEVCIPEPEQTGRKRAWGKRRPDAVRIQCRAHLDLSRGVQETDIAPQTPAGGALKKKKGATRRPSMLSKSRLG